MAAKANVASAAALYMYARVAFNHMIAPVPILIVTDIRLHLKPKYNLYMLHACLQRVCFVLYM